MNLHEEVKLMHEHIEHKRPSIDKMKDMLTKQGFVIKDIEYDQFNYWFVDGTAMLNHYFIRFFMDAWIAFLPANQVEEIFDRIESRLNEYARHYGSIKLSIPFALINAVKG